MHVGHIYIERMALASIACEMVNGRQNSFTILDHQ